MNRKKQNQKQQQQSLWFFTDEAIHGNRFFIFLNHAAALLYSVTFQVISSGVLRLWKAEYKEICKDAIKIETTVL